MRNLFANELLDLRVPSAVGTADDKRFGPIWIARFARDECGAPRGRLWWLGRLAAPPLANRLVCHRLIHVPAFQKERRLR